MHNSCDLIARRVRLLTHLVAILSFIAILNASITIWVLSSRQNGITIPSEIAVQRVRIVDPNGVERAAWGLKQSGVEFWLRSERGDVWFECGTEGTPGGFACLGYRDEDGQESHLE